MKKIKKHLFKYLANFLIGTGVGLILLIFAPPFFQEVKYQSIKITGKKYLVEDQSQKSESLPDQSSFRVLTPVSTDFSLIIPKIGANARIFPNVNPFSEEEFLPVLKMGIAHAKGTSFPDQGKNIYLFAHSTDAFYRAGQYNAVFYLVGKLSPGDEVDIYYKNQLFKYSVYEKKVVSPQAVQYLDPTKEEILTLQTCYPPGTTLKRLIVRAKRIIDKSYGL